ncbi:MAG: nitrilase-related carbon-nitrogen hydrolase [Actinomycetales bacterium]
MRQMRVRVVQPAAGPLDPDAAMEMVSAAIDGAAGQVDLLILPELSTTRYDIRRHIASAAPALDGPQFDRVREQVREAALVAVIGFVEAQGEAIYNSAMVVDTDGSVAAVVRKSHLFAGEQRVFAAGASIAPVRTAIGLLGVAICYDIEFPEVARTLALAGAEALVVISANMHPYTDYHLTYAKARAMENGIPLALSNWVGPGPRFDFLGRSCIVSAQGELLADAGEAPGHADAVIQIAPMAQLDADLDYLAHRRPELYGT